MILAIAIPVLLATQTPQSTEVWRIARDAQHAIEAGTDAKFDRAWRMAAARNPSDRRPVFAEAMMALLRYRYEQADSLFDAIIRAEPGPSELAAASHLGMALWRAIGSDVARADSLFDLARKRSRRGACVAHRVRRARQPRETPRSTRRPQGGARAHQARARNRRPSDRRRAGGASLQRRDVHRAARRHHWSCTDRRRHTRAPSVAETARDLGGCRLLRAQIAERAGYFDIAEREADEAVRALRARALHARVGDGEPVARLRASHARLLRAGSRGSRPRGSRGADHAIHQRRSVGEDGIWRNCTSRSATPKRRA